MPAKLWTSHTSRLTTVHRPTAEFLANKFVIRPLEIGRGAVSGREGHVRALTVRRTFVFGDVHSVEGRQSVLVEEAENRTRHSVSSLPA